MLQSLIELQSFNGILRVFYMVPDQMLSALETFASQG